VFNIKAKGTSALPIVQTYLDLPLLVVEIPTMQAKPKQPNHCLCVHAPVFQPRSCPPPHPQKPSAEVDTENSK